jgi:DNA-binding MarR family transcriptional regulator
MATFKLSKRLLIGVVVHEVSRLRRKAIDQLLQPMGITGAQWWVLTYISLRPGLSQVRLADELNMGKVALGGLIERLMKSSLLERRPDERDKRANRIYLSDAGLKLAREISRVSTGVQEEALRGISNEDLEVAINVLTRMQSNLEPMVGTNEPGRAGNLLRTSSSYQI